MISRVSCRINGGMGGLGRLENGIKLVGHTFRLEITSKSPHYFRTFQSLELPPLLHRFFSCFDCCSFTGVDSVLSNGYNFIVRPCVYYD